MLELSSCHGRQKRLLDKLGNTADAVVISAPHHVYYFSGYWTDWRHQSALVLDADGRSLLLSPNTPAKNVAADNVRAFEANWKSTLRQEQPAVVATAVTDVLSEWGVKRIGFDASAVASQLVAAGRFAAAPIDDTLFQLRRIKDADELALMRIAVRACEAMFARAKQIIEPGVEELTVFAELHAAAVTSTGQPMTGMLGNDFACGAGGGPPRANRRAAAGELYVLDLGPTYRGYFSDSCRTFAVDRKPTDPQMNAWEDIASCFPVVESLAKPGASGRAIYRAVDEHLQQRRGSGLPHHLGHGVGLQPHEYPHLNPMWDDTLLEGEIFTVEPGVYASELRGGIRIENIYRVTETGVENLLNFPMGLI